MAEGAKAAADAALRFAQGEADEQKAALREGLAKLVCDLEVSEAAIRRSAQQDLASVHKGLASEVTTLRREMRTAAGELRHRYAACWEGMRESRVELGDVMQSLHLLVERSEIQHLVNQILAAGVFDAPVGLADGGGKQGGGGGGGMPPISPRGDAHTRTLGGIHHKKCCVKRGECTCQERLGRHSQLDPRVQIDRLLERQLKLLLAVRAVWKRGEASRGPLPHVPRLPPALGEGIGNGWGAAGDGLGTGGAVGREEARRAGAAGAEVVGAYCDGGVLGGYDEGGQMGQATLGLPVRLADL